MSKYSDMCQCLVEKFTISHADANKFVREFYITIKDFLESDKIVKVKGLGTFKLVDTSARETIDVNTHERILIESKQRVTFTPETAVRDRINSPFVQFESIEIDDDIVFTDIDSRYAVAAAPAAPSTPATESDDEPPTAETDNEPPAAAPAAEEENAPAEEENDNPAEENDNPPEENDNPAEENDSSEQGDAPPVDDGDSPADEGDGPTYDDDDDDDEAPATSHKAWRYVLISLGIVILLAVVGFFAYQEGVKQGLLLIAPPPAEEETLVVAEPLDTLATSVPAVDDDELLAAQDTLAAEALPEPPVADAPAAETAVEEDYNRYPRVATGAYDIVGLETVVTVLAGETLEGISRRYLGEGMVCYVEAYNGGIKTVQAGDKVKIPKVKVKERLKNRLQR